MSAPAASRPRRARRRTAEPDTAAPELAAAAEREPAAGVKLKRKRKAGAAATGGERSGMQKWSQLMQAVELELHAADLARLSNELQAERELRDQALEKIRELRAAGDARAAEVSRLEQELQETRLERDQCYETIADGIMSAMRLEALEQKLVGCEAMVEEFQAKATSNQVVLARLDDDLRAARPVVVRLDKELLKAYAEVNQLREELQKLRSKHAAEMRAVHQSELVVVPTTKKRKLPGPVSSESDGEPLGSDPNDERSAIPPLPSRMEQIVVLHSLNLSARGKELGAVVHDARAAPHGEAEHAAEVCRLREALRKAEAAARVASAIQLEELNSEHAAKTRAVTIQHHKEMMNLEIRSGRNWWEGYVQGSRQMRQLAVLEHPDLVGLLPDDDGGLPPQPAADSQGEEWLTWIACD